MCLAVTRSSILAMGNRTNAGPLWMKFTGFHWHNPVEDMWSVKHFANLYNMVTWYSCRFIIIAYHTSVLILYNNILPSIPAINKIQMRSCCLYQVSGLAACLACRARTRCCASDLPHVETSGPKPRWEHGCSAVTTRLMIDVSLGFLLYLLFIDDVLIYRY